MEAEVGIDQESPRFTLKVADNDGLCKSTPRQLASTLCVLVY